MAEFQEVCKQWRRMCKAQDDTNCGACESCPMMDNGASCIAVYEDDFDKVDFDHIEQIVTAWAAEHPEPVYPTWREWLIKLGIISFELDFHSLLNSAPTTLTNTVKAYLNEEGSKPIPVDLAEKLGIEPKEG